MSQSYYERLEIVECCNCHMNFGMTPEFKAEKLKDHSTFTCPAGHRQHFAGESEEEKLRRENQRLVQNRAFLEDRIRQEHEHKEAEKRSHIATRGHLTRIRKRAKGGVCPCCNRTFSSLARHMTHMHPEFAKEKA